MNINNLHQTRADIVDAQIRSLEEAVNKQARRLKKQQHANAKDNTNRASSITMSITPDCWDDTATNNTKTASNNSNWTDVYKKWDSWEDVEEIEQTLNKTKKKLSKLKKNNERQKKNINTNNLQRMSTSSSDLAVPSSCCNSHNRNAEIEVVRMSTGQRLKQMKSFREKGNKEFNVGQYNNACKWYDKSLIYYEYCFRTTSKNEKRNVQEERMLSLLNLSACYLELKQYRKCIESCTELLDEASSNGSTTIASDATNVRPDYCNARYKKHIKALFRRAKAYRLTHQLQQAKDDLDEAKKLMKLCNDNFHSTSIENEYGLVIDAIKTYVCNCKNIAQRMMKKK